MGKAFISTFTYECELAFNKEGEDKSIEIPKQCIRYITVDHDYENKMKQNIETIRESIK